MTDRIGIIIQARFSSTRLPGKVLRNLGGKTVLERVIDRARRIQKAHSLVVATSVSDEDMPIVDLCESLQINVFRGSEEDVLDRYYQCAKQNEFDWIVRITSDCPLLDPKLIDELIERAVRGNHDFSSLSVMPDSKVCRTFPHGVDAEVYRFRALAEAWKRSELADHREHVGGFLTDHPQRYSIYWHSCSENYSFFRVTLDYLEDLERIRDVYEQLMREKGEDFDWQDIVTIMKRIRRKVFFRVEVGDSAGMGHQTRSQSIAKALGSRGIDCVFLINEIAPGISPLFEPTTLTSTPDESVQAREVLRVLRLADCRVLIVDSYRLGKNFYDCLKAEAPQLKILAIEDHSEKQNLNLDGVIRFFSQRNSPKSSVPVIAEGASFFPLRQEMTTLPRRDRSRWALPLRAFVCFGASDLKELAFETSKILRNVKEIDEVDVILSREHSLQKMRGTFPEEKFRFHFRPRDFPQLLNSCDFAIVSGGNMAWEALSLGIPCIVIQTEDNQSDSIRMISESQSALVFESFMEFNREALQEFLGQYPPFHSELSAKSQRLVDSKGAHRTAEKILQFAFGA